MASRNLEVFGSVLLELVFPIDLETKPANVEFLGFLHAEDAQDGDRASEFYGHGVTLSFNSRSDQRGWFRWSLSGLDTRPIRWIVEDALTLVRREARRGNQYNAMVLDPPRFGRGPDGEIWRLQDSLPELLGACARILSARPVFALVNVYATVLTQRRMEKEAEALHAGLKTMLGESRITINAGGLAIQDAAGRRISASAFARAR